MSLIARAFCIVEGPHVECDRVDCEIELDNPIISKNVQYSITNPLIELDNLMPHERMETTE